MASIYFTNINTIMNWTQENDKYQVRLQRIYKDRYGSEEYIEMQTITDASVISFYKKDEITNVFMWLADFDKNSTTEAELFWNILNKTSNE